MVARELYSLQRHLADLTLKANRRCLQLLERICELHSSQEVDQALPRLVVPITQQEIQLLCDL